MLNKLCIKLSELYIDHGSAIFIGTLLCTVLAGVMFSRKKPRLERPEPPAIFGPIRGMYVCYQCDTIFNTTRCPRCKEDAAIPLVQLTGSIEEDKKLSSVIGKLKDPGAWKLPAFPDKQMVALAPACKPQSKNGASEVPMGLS
jgi:hypothetical protein